MRGRARSKGCFGRDAVRRDGHRAAAVRWPLTVVIGVVGLSGPRVMRARSCAATLGGHFQPHGELPGGDRGGVFGAVLPGHVRGSSEQCRGDDRKALVGYGRRGDYVIGGR